MRRDVVTNSKPDYIVHMKKGSLYELSATSKIGFAARITTMDTRLWCARSNRYHGYQIVMFPALILGTFLFFHRLGVPSVTELKIIKCTRRYVVIKLPHQVPWPVSNSNNHNWQKVVTCFHSGIYSLSFLWTQLSITCVNTASNLSICHYKNLRRTWDWPPLLSTIQSQS